MSEMEKSLGTIRLDDERSSEINRTPARDFLV
jgi:hypothetical protein